MTKTVEDLSEPTQGPGEANTRYHRRAAQAVGVLSSDLAMPHHEERTRLCCFSVKVFFDSVDKGLEVHHALKPFLDRYLALRKILRDTTPAPPLPAF